MKAKIVSLAVLTVLIASIAPLAQAGGTCAGASTGGDWRSYGGGLSNARNQWSEGSISAATVGAVEPAWKFKPSDVGASGTFSNTPVIADGCVYLASNAGWVMALNADTGEHVWNQKFSGAGQTLLGGVIVGSPVVENGMVFVGVSRPGTPYVAAMDQETGDILWTATVEGYSAETAQANSLINASPVYFDGMIFQGFAGNEGGAPARGGFSIVDASRECSETSASTCATPVEGATGGSIKVHTYTITDAEYAVGYRGASVWCTAAIDPATKYAYACGGNPASKRIEARNSNALLKIDMDESRSTFGEIVGAYKGDTDQYYPGLDRQPACDALGDTLVVVWSLACLQLDLDFGASPQLFTDPLGRLMLGDVQKSGVYHVVYADTMQRAWTTIVGAPCQACNAASPAFDNGTIYTAGTPGAVLTAISRDAGRYRWAMPVPDATHFFSTTVTNGVVYTMDSIGSLSGFDASTGVPVLKRSFTVDTGGPVADTGSTGIAVARHTIYAASGEWLIAYR